MIGVQHVIVDGGNVMGGVLSGGLVVVHYRRRRGR
jgi:hypothetical protein